MTKTMIINGIKVVVERPALTEEERKKREKIVKQAIINICKETR